jgi:hypothetical protein
MCFWCAQTITQNVELRRDAFFMKTHMRFLTVGSLETTQEVR